MKETKGFKIKIELLDETLVPNSYIRPQIDVLNKTQGGIVVQDESHLISVLNELSNEYDKNGFIECNSKILNSTHENTKLKIGGATH